MFSVFDSFRAEPTGSNSTKVEKKIRKYSKQINSEYSKHGCLFSNREKYIYVTRNVQQDNNNIDDNNNNVSEQTRF